MEVQNTAHFYQFQQIPDTFQNDLSLECLGVQDLNLSVPQLSTGDVGQNMFATNFCTIDVATPHNVNQEGSQSQSSPPNHHAYMFYNNTLSQERATLVPGPKMERNSSQNTSLAPTADHNNNHHHIGDVKVERALESGDSTKHTAKTSPPSSTQTALSNLVNQKPPVYTKWTEKEDELLRAAVSIYGPHKWSLVATNVPNRTPMQCSARWVGALNPSILKGRWTAQEDSALTEAVQQYINAVDSQNNPQPIPWNKISKRIPQRTGAQCQARWTEALDPRIKKGKWSPKEDEILKEGVSTYGRCWIRIAEMIDGRTQVIERI
ncbi:9098_t:CDS:2 [Acaulospora morrowiae]|uniref:9098_t:CDS:1 n=1 Tax=Acaulospora morrowiae TaxID=94023 RepID=A0A9N8WDG1_9GLOM|nr:9098_t:CDS:2 [Acaulospora morrowiae]